MSDRQIVFVDRRKPPLEAGDYTIAVTQTVTLTRTDPDLPAMDPITEPYTTTRAFTVRGERFSLDAGEVSALFPPPNNRGEYANVLPHVVFERRTLPWERSPVPGDTDTSWLAVLLFEADEAPPLQQVRVGDLFRTPFPPDAGAPATRPSTLNGSTACYVDVHPRFDLESGEYRWDPCQVIDVPFKLFQAIAPSLGDLKWLAHVRSVPAGGKADTLEAETLDRSVVVGNRLPKSNTTCVAHLVSLEGLASALPAADNDGNYTAKTITVGAAAATMIRLVSLKTWTFTSVDPKETFTGYLQHLSIEPPVLSRKAPEAEDDAEDSPEEKAARADVVNAFGLGYTAVNHQTRLGDHTVSWYRGPLLPYESSPTIVPAPTSTGHVISASDQAVRYDPGTGMIDVSYAAAWQTGRLLALASKAFSTALYNWKRAAAQKTVLAVQNEWVRAWLTTLNAGNGSDAQKAATTILTTHLAPRLAGRRRGETGQ